MLYQVLNFVNLKISALSEFPLIGLFNLRNNRRLQQIIHVLGLSCIGGAIFLQIIVFLNIIRQGYFLATEQNQLILSLEVTLTSFTLIYFVYIYQSLIRTLK